MGIFDFIEFLFCIFKTFLYTLPMQKVIQIFSILRAIQRYFYFFIRHYKKNTLRVLIKSLFLVKCNSIMLSRAPSLLPYDLPRLSSAFPKGLVWAPVRGFLPQAGSLSWGLINIYSSQLGREMSGRGAKDPLRQRGQRRWQASRVLPSLRTPKKPQYAIRSVLGQSSVCVTMWVCDEEAERGCMKGGETLRQSQKETGPRGRGVQFRKGFLLESHLDRRPPVELTGQ